MRNTPRISVIGAGQCGPELASLAFDLGKGIAIRGYILVCGGLGGVMEAACKGAAEFGGTTIGIIPGTDRGEANPFVGIPVATGLGHMRNFLVVCNGDIVCALGGGYGTLSEIGLARKIGLDVIALDGWNHTTDVIVATDIAHMLSNVDARLRNLPVRQAEV